MFKQFSLLCKEWGLYGQTLVAVDGSKFRASNFKKKYFNEKKLKRHLKYIDTKIEQYLNELEEGDQSEANTHKPSAAEINQHIQELKERKKKYEEMRIWGYNYFQTRDLNSVNAESSLVFLAYNITRAINILGVKKMVSRLLHISVRRSRQVNKMKASMLMFESHVVNVKAIRAITDNGS